MGNLVISVAIARSASAEEFGFFAVAWAIYLLATGAIRAGVAESALAKGDLSDARSSVPAAFVIALVVGIVSASIAIFTAQTFLLIIAVSLPLLTVFEYVRVIEMSLGRASTALFMDISWTLASIILFTFGNVWGIRSTFLVAGWAAFPAFVIIALLVIVWRRKDRIDYRFKIRQIRLAYMVDYLMGSGSMQLSMALLPIVSSSTVVGALRGAGTILSPVTLITGTLRPVFIATAGKANRSAPGSQSVLRPYFRANILLVVVSVPFVALAVLIPDSLGRLLLGDSWETAALVLLPIGIEAIAALLATSAFAGHRVLDAAKRVLVVRAILSVFRIGGVLLGGALYGVVAVAWAMALVSVIGLIVWTVSFVQIQKSVER